MDTAFAYRQAVVQALGKQIDALPQTTSWERTISTWIARIEAKSTRFHHLQRHAIFTRFISQTDSTVVHQAPITHGNASNLALNLVLRGHAHDYARSWFMGHLDNATEISDDILRLLRASWAGTSASPWDLYYKVLVEYFWPTIEGMDIEADDNPLLEHLTEFQVEAYQYAKGILRRFGGVFLADVVGLGKTFIALALLRWLQDRQGHVAVVVAPPAVLPTWEDLANEFRVKISTVSIGKLEELDRYEDREVLVIDESHNFRNQRTLRYEQLQRWLRPGGTAANRQVILLSATPQNNDPVDVQHQLALFPDTYTRLPYRGESLDGFFRSVRAGKAVLTDLLQHVVVRRTRRFIQTAYPDSRLRHRVGPGRYETIPLRFPRRISGPEQCLRYSIDATYIGGLYGQILTTLARMRYPRHALGGYVLPSVHDSRIQGLRHVGTVLRGLYKVLLLKRLESSLYAFRLTLERLRDGLREALEDLGRGRIRIRKAVAVPAAEEDDADDPLTAGDRNEVPASLFDVVRLREDLEIDLSSVEDLLEHVGPLKSQLDAKAIRLCEYLSRRRPSEHRTIIFTQFAETAAYLERALTPVYKDRVAVVTGATRGKLAVTRRFAPRANPGRAEVPAEEQIDLLITTDVLSEGINLQDADTLINYDLHWNPVRLIQRAGRIDRIGSINDEVHIASFLPECELEANLGIESVLRKRIGEFIKVFGDDSSVLPAEDRPDEAATIAAYTGTALERAEDDELDGMSRHIERILRLRRDEPERYAQILEMRAARRGLSAAHAPATVALRLGWYWGFYQLVNDVEVARVDDAAGLDAFYAHATGGPALTTPELAPLRPLADAARRAFEQDAQLFRQQQTRPRLSPTQEFVMDRLRQYLQTCAPTRRVLVEQIVSWLRQGYASQQIERNGRVWRRENLSPLSVFNEVVPLYRRFPPSSEELGELRMVAIVGGS
ncbi:helicase-related protein [Sorangium sp. So ce1024]|uniref:helicase-related protein n=1 Tax=Sorangium sp. So ce1024 TaxID=3133327 RepID=UPI003F08F78E